MHSGGKGRTRTTTRTFSELEEPSRARTGEGGIALRAEPGDVGDEVYAPGGCRAQPTAGGACPWEAVRASRGLEGLQILAAHRTSSRAFAAPTC